MFAEEENIVLSPHETNRLRSPTGYHGASPAHRLREIQDTGFLLDSSAELSRKLDIKSGSTSSVDKSVHKSFTNADCPYPDALTNQIAYFVGIERARLPTPISCG